MSNKPEWRGVTIDSRYDDVREVMVMTAVVERLGRLGRHGIQEIFCDSKATWSFTVRTTLPPGGQARFDLGKNIEELLFGMVGGHNGITIDTVDIDPEWQDDWEDTA